MYRVTKQPIPTIYQLINGKVSRRPAISDLVFWDFATYFQNFEDWCRPIHTGIGYHWILDESDAGNKKKKIKLMVCFVSIKTVTWGISNWVVNGQILEGRAICGQFFFFKLVWKFCNWSFFKSFLKCNKIIF